MGKNGVLVYYQTDEYYENGKYIDAKDNKVEFGKYKNMVTISVCGDTVMEFPFDRFKNGLFIVIENGKPQRVIEFSQNYNGEYYIERKPTYQDNLFVQSTELWRN